MFNKGDKVRTKDHIRYYSVIPGNATLVEPQPTAIKGGRQGIVTGFFDNGNGTTSIEVQLGRSDVREFDASELEKTD